MRKKKQFELIYANSFEELKSKLDYFQTKLNLEDNFIESVIIRSIKRYEIKEGDNIRNDYDWWAMVIYY